MGHEGRRSDATLETKLEHAETVTLADPVHLLEYEVFGLNLVRHADFNKVLLLRPVEAKALVRICGLGVLVREVERAEKWRFLDTRPGFLDELLVISTSGLRLNRPLHLFSLQLGRVGEDRHVRLEVGDQLVSASEVGQLLLLELLFLGIAESHFVTDQLVSRVFRGCQECLDVIDGFFKDWNRAKAFVPL